MIKFRKSTKAALVAVVFIALLSACQKQEGPAERAGKEVDKAASQVGEQIEKAGENVQKSAKGDGK